MTNNRNENISYGELRVGIMFFFYDDPDECKQQIAELFHDFCDLTEAEFTYYRYNQDYGFKELKKDSKNFFCKILDKSDFSSYNHLILTNATKEKTQTVRFEMMMSNKNENNVVNLPNYMYFELLPTIDYIDILHFIRTAFYGITYHYCCCNLLMGANDFQDNRGRQYSAKFARENRCITDRYSVFSNFSLRCNLENKIDGPNMIQVLSEKLYNKIGLEKLIFDGCEKNDIYHELGEDYIIIALSEETLSDESCFDKYQALYNILENIILDMEKPQMYWKIDEWEKWRNRFIQ